MHVTLYTTESLDRVDLFFDEERQETAGTIISLCHSDTPGVIWRHINPDGDFTGPRRKTIKAAQYDALAWAEDLING